jgi:hypothetical protein
MTLVALTHGPDYVTWARRSLPDGPTVAALGVLLAPEMSGEATACPPGCKPVLVITEDIVAYVPTPALRSTSRPVGWPDITYRLPQPGHRVRVVRKGSPPIWSVHCSCGVGIGAPRPSAGAAVQDAEEHKRSVQDRRTPVMSVKADARTVEIYPFPGMSEDLVRWWEPEPVQLRDLDRAVDTGRTDVGSVLDALRGLLDVTLNLQYQAMNETPPNLHDELNAATRRAHLVLRAHGRL